MLIRTILGVLLACAGPGYSQTQSQGSGTFRFQNNFRVNLHHFVRAEARRQSFGAEPGLKLSELSGNERSAWTGALEAYSGLAKLNLIFDEGLVKINNALAAAGDARSLPPGLIEPKIAAALNAAAPVYRAHLWERHRRENEHWIAEFRPLIERHAKALTQALASAYHVSWPKEPILVDLSCESGPTLAYTTEGPAGTAGHSVIAPLKTAERDVGFETVFHEASHTVDAEIIRMLAGEAARQKVKIPEDLWHMLIFYTSGELVKRELGKQNDPSYQPYAYRFNLYGRGHETDRKALEETWQPYLDGKTSFDSALRELVRTAAQ